jgi:precorrin-2 methylase
MGRFTVVGLGPGSPEYLLPLARQVIEEAETLAGGRRHLAPFEGGKKKLIFLENGLESLLDAVDSRRESERIALLLSGDPCIFSLLGRIAARFSPGDYEVVPGLSSFQLLFTPLSSRNEGTPGEQRRQATRVLLERCPSREPSRALSRQRGCTARRGSPDALLPRLGELGAGGRRLPEETGFSGPPGDAGGKAGVPE